MVVYYTWMIDYTRIAYHHVSQHKKLFFPHSASLFTSPEYLEMYSMAYSEHSAINCDGNVAFSSVHRSGLDCSLSLKPGLTTFSKGDWCVDLSNSTVFVFSKEKKLTHALIHSCTLDTVNNTTLLSCSYFFHCLTLWFGTSERKYSIIHFVTGFMSSKRKCSFYSESALNYAFSFLPRALALLDLFAVK